VTAYYNEFDPAKAHLLRALMEEGHIAHGRVDERSITDIDPGELAGYVQCHFFAGIGGWSLALRLAGWPDDRPVWSGSCPCQPFSDAGKGLAEADDRHLWPMFFRLIRECKPGVVFGEQVASAAALRWWDGVSHDLETADYACGAVDICAASVGAPHIRQRLYWVADSHGRGPQERRAEDRTGICQRDRGGEASPTIGTATPEHCLDGGMDNAASLRGAQHEHDKRKRPASEENHSPDGGGDTGGLGDTGGTGFPDAQQEAVFQTGRREEGRAAAQPGRARWADCRIILCRDGKARRVPLEPAFFPLAPRLPGRNHLLRGAGDSIVPPLAAEFIKACMQGGPD